MSKYSCKCPAPGCDFVLVVEANGFEDAFRMMYEGGKIHIVENHPDFPDLDEDRAYKYAQENMKLI